MNTMPPKFLIGEVVIYNNRQETIFSAEFIAAEWIYELEKVQNMDLKIREDSALLIKITE